MNGKRFRIKRWVKVVGVLLLVIGGLPGVFYFKGQIALNRKIAELKAQGLPTSFAELEEQSKLPAGTPNAADIYLKAFAAYRELGDPNKQKLLPVLGKQHIPADNEPYPQEQMDAAAEFIELNKEMFDLLLQAGQVKECSYPMVYDAGFPSLGNAYEGIRKTSKSLSLAALYYIEMNQKEKALETIKTGMYLANSLSRSNFLIAHLSQLAIVSNNVSSILRYLNHNDSTDTQLLELQMMIDKAKIYNFNFAMTGEICAYIEFGKKPSTPVLDDTWLITLSRVTNLFTMNIIKIIEFHQRILTIQQLPTENQVEYCKDLEKEINTQGIAYYLTNILTPSLGRLYQIHLRLEADLNCATIGLAIEQYRLKENRLPETVDKLVPEYLKEVHIDPFDGKPLKYKRTEPGYMVYSIGMDCVDDGGKPRDRNSSKNKSCDEVFRMYR